VDAPSDAAATYTDAAIAGFVEKNMIRDWDAGEIQKAIDRGELKDYSKKGVLELRDKDGNIVIYKNFNRLKELRERGVN